MSLFALRELLAPLHVREEKRRRDGGERELLKFYLFARTDCDRVKTGSSRRTILINLMHNLHSIAFILLNFMQIARLCRRAASSEAKRGQKRIRRI